MKNKNPELPNRHALIIAASGGGKSQAAKQIIPTVGVRALFFDPHHDHQAHRITGPVNQFAMMVSRAIASGKPFRLAWDCEPTPDNFDQFMRVCLAALDGNRLLYCMAEEINCYSETANKATKHCLRFMNESRKYGGIFIGTSQKPEHIPKTITDQCETKYVGRLASKSMRKKYSEECNRTLYEFEQLDNLEFFKTTGTADPAQKVVFEYKK